LPLLREKFAKSVEGVFNPEQIASLIGMFGSAEQLDRMPAEKFMEIFYKQPVPMEKLLA
jgi:hypothetical protein